jgi:hypothetical protein
MNRTITLDDGGQFTFVRTNQELTPTEKGNTIYIISIMSHSDENGEPIRGTHVTERSLRYIIDNFPDVYWVRIYISDYVVGRILEKAYYRIFDTTIIPKPGESVSFPIR